MVEDRLSASPAPIQGQGDDPFPFNLVSLLGREVSNGIEVFLVTPWNLAKSFFPKGRGRKSRCGSCRSEFEFSSSSEL